MRFAVFLFSLFAVITLFLIWRRIPRPLVFQALSFYQKLGYQIFGQLEDYPVGHTRYFLQKRALDATGGT